MTTCLHTLFEEQAALHPDAAAIKSDRGKITYQDLDGKSNQLANFLLASGIKTGDILSICLERSIETVTAILGILKCGAAYAPIDPKTPEQRLDFLLEDVNSPILIANDGFSGKIIRDQKIIRLDSDGEIIAGHSTDPPNLEIDDRNIAVILYTSGSTGYPKGVLLSHRSLVNRLIWDRATYSHNPADIVLQQSSCTFDFSILEIFMALANGGMLVLARPEFHHESNYLIELIQREKITKMGTVPSLLKAYVDLPGFEKCSTLKQVFIGGETLDCHLQDKFLGKSSADLINIYGPTEGSISVLNWTCRRDHGDKTVPIGFPAAGMRIYLLDERRNPVPDGDIGEIYISGPGVADGYFKRPELTAGSFLPDPFAGDAPAVMYKTGDLGKKSSDGSYHFYGRKDDQIKIRGIRIELQEIEYHLAACSGIAHCVVAGIKNENEETKLAAYIIPAGGVIPDLDEIRRSLLSKLPDYMVPNMFVRLNEFALSPNGKINRRTLPRPDESNLLSQTSHTPPANETERQLLGIWEKVLKAGPIGTTDPFDKVGGDSLAATAIHLLIEKEMGCILPVSALFHAITIEEQSRIINDGNKIINSSGLIQLRSTGEKTPILFVKYFQGTGITNSIALMRQIDPDRPFLATVPFGEDPGSVPDSIEECARHYVQLLVNHFPYGEYIVGGYSSGGLVAFEAASMLRELNKSVKLLLLVDTYHPSILHNELLDYKTKKRVVYYLKSLAKGDLRTKKEILKYLAAWGIGAIRRPAEGGMMHPVLPRILPVIRRNYRKKILQDENKNISLTLRYNPGTFRGNALLISATDEHKPNSFAGKPKFNSWKENASRWANEITGKLEVRELPVTHASILEYPDVEKTAKIINDYLLKERI